MAQLKPAGNSCQPQYFIFQVVPASTRSSDHLEKWHSAAHLSPILVENNGRNRSFAPTLLPALHQLAFNICCIKLLARKHIWIMYTLAARFFFYIKRLNWVFQLRPNLLNCQFTQIGRNFPACRWYHWLSDSCLYGYHQHASARLKMDSRLPTTPQQLEWSLLPEVWRAKDYFSQKTVLLSFRTIGVVKGTRHALWISPKG